MVEELLGQQFSHTVPGSPSIFSVRRAQPTKSVHRSVSREISFARWEYPELELEQASLTPSGLTSAVRTRDRNKFSLSLPPSPSVRGYSYYVFHESHVFVLFNFGYYSVAVELEYRRVTGLTYNVNRPSFSSSSSFLSRRASTHVAVTVLRRPLHELRVHPARTCEHAYRWFERQIFFSSWSD